MIMKQMDFLKKIGCLLGLMVLVVPIIAQEPVQYNSAEAEPQKSIYCQEFESLQKQEPYSIIFSQNSDNDGEKKKCLTSLNGKHLTPFQKFVLGRRAVEEDIVFISSIAMPTLHSYIHDLCKQHSMDMPIICITQLTKGFRASATKFGMGSGIIMIEPETFKLSAKAFEAVMAHELGHIKHNHVNKLCLLNLLPCAITSYIIHSYLFSRHDYSSSQAIKTIGALGLVYLINKTSEPLSRRLVSQRFEKQADEFAYKDCKKAEGVIELFEPIKREMVQNRSDTEDLLCQQTTQDYERDMEDDEEYQEYKKSNFISRFFIRVFWEIEPIYYQFSWWLFYPESHPSHTERVKAAREYLAAHTI
jgi:Zn-dependent protease with chaperone function